MGFFFLVRTIVSDVSSRNRFLLLAVLFSNRSELLGRLQSRLILTVVLRKLTGLLLTSIVNMMDVIWIFMHSRIHLNHPGRVCLIRKQSSRNRRYFNDCCLYGSPTKQFAKPGAALVPMTVPPTYK